MDVNGRTEAIADLADPSAVAAADLAEEAAAERYRLFRWFAEAVRQAQRRHAAMLRLEAELARLHGQSRAAGLRWGIGDV